MLSLILGIFDALKITQKPLRQIESPDEKRTRVISGFNTDVVHEGIVYHVQTEDMGTKTAQLVTLVYQRGEILANKRTGYEDLLRAELDEKLLAERLQRQHKLICAAIAAGRIEDLKRLNSATTTTVTTTPNAAPAKSKKKSKASTNGGETQIAESATLDIAKTDVATLVVPTNDGAAKLSSLNDLILDLPQQTIPSAQTFENSVALPSNQSPSRTVVRAIAPGIADFARVEEQSSQISLSLIGETELRAGQTINLRVSVFEGVSAAANAEVKVKILGTSFRPMLFSIKTDAHGIAAQTLTLPMFKTGRAAMLITAVVGKYEAELRRIIAQAE